MTDDPLDAMKARWSYIQGFLFPWMREDNDPITEAETMSPALYWPHRWRLWRR